MKQTGMTWAIVLTAGAGSRLQGLTRLSGRAVPKQFCSLLGEQSLFRDAVERARRVVAPENVMTIVAAEHGEFWEEEVTPLAPGNVIVQPANRGTAAGILLPLLSILDRDPQARIVVIPSDHFVAREKPLAGCLSRAVRAVEQNKKDVVLVGITPDCPEPSYGWIVSSPCAGSLRSVTRFVEKPESAIARELHLSGAVWNSFLFAADGRALLAAFAWHLPDLTLDMTSAWEGSAEERGHRLERLYASLKSEDFCRRILEPLGQRLGLGLVKAPSCGWTDLGTPERLRECLSGLRTSRASRGLSLTSALQGCPTSLANLAFLCAHPEPHLSLRAAQ